MIGAAMRPYGLRHTQRTRSFLTGRGVCVRKVFDAFQAANFAVQAFPWAPDTLALAARLAQEAGMPAAEDVLATRFPSAITAPKSSSSAATSSATVPQIAGIPNSVSAGS